MTPGEKAFYIIAQAHMLNSKAIDMLSENDCCKRCSHPIVHSEQAFIKMVVEFVRIINRV